MQVMSSMGHVDACTCEQMCCDSGFKAWSDEGRTSCFCGGGMQILNPTCAGGLFTGVMYEHRARISGGMYILNSIRGAASC